MVIESYDFNFPALVAVNLLLLSDSYKAFYSIFWINKKAFEMAEIKLNLAPR
jgi:hypothetical protein